MGRKRTKDLHLPARVYREHGAFYYREAYQDQHGKTRSRCHHLGRTEAEMWRRWRDFAVPEDRIRTLSDLMDAYAREVLGARSESARADYQRSLKPLRGALGHIPPEALRSHHCYEFLAVRGKTAPVRANRDLAVLASVCKYGIKRGVIERNPVHGVERLPEAPRERLPEAWEVAAFLEGAPALLRAYLPLKVLTGLRQGDLLRMKREQLTEEGILVREGKRGKPRLIEWSDELRAAVDVMKALRAAPSLLYLIANRKGQPYTGDGFRSIWQKQMRRALERGRLSESFTEHDLRAVTATEAKERAQELLAHEDARTTRIYVRSKGPRRVKPLR